MVECRVFEIVQGLGALAVSLNNEKKVTLVECCVFEIIQGLGALAMSRSYLTIKRIIRRNVRERASSYNRAGGWRASY